MVSKIFVVFLFFHVFVFTEVLPATAQTWIRAGYWYSGSEFPSSDVDSALFTHLLCAFASVDSTSFQLSLYSPSDESQFSNFTATVRQKNPSVATLLSIGGGTANYSTFSSMVSNSSSRKYFIDSSIRTARVYGFQGLDLCWVSANTSSDMFNMGILFEEWRVAAEAEAKSTSRAQLILTASVQFTPGSDSTSFPSDSIQKNLNWIHVMAYDYYMPVWANFTAAPAALYDPTSSVNTDSGIRAWITSGVSSNKLVLALPFYGYAWKLENHKQNGIGAPATGPAITDEGDMSYKDIKSYIERYKANVVYNATYVVNYCTIGTSWIGFDGAEVVKIKVSYAKDKNLLGYVVWQVPYDDDKWVLSQAAAEVGSKNGKNSGKLLAIILPTTAAGVVLSGFLLYYYFWMRKLKSKENVDSVKESKNRVTYPAGAGDFNNNVPNLTIYSLAEIEAATNKFSFENKLGEGGYGPVYKGILKSRQEIAVKKLSKTSTQGYEEFANEVMLTAKLQHVNLVRVLGFCTDREEQMLIYEYMPNKSLDYYLFDPIRRYILDWRKRVHIIEGITQGLLYLQEYSRLTIIHRDLKASNVLLDDDMKPKISDFGMARIFAKDNLEANTGRIVGTYGYVPPEYVKRGIYSTKSDVYSFGVLLLQIISGKKVSFLYGHSENLSLLEHAHDLWKDGRGMQFVDQSLDDTDSSCKLMRCLQIALLCVQESPNDRPSMLEVFSMLKNETADVMIPKKPAFSKPTAEDEANKSPSQEDMFSVNDATISEVVAR
ncbi:cysteine-rich receptor-like protein kinase 19 [Melia azedarach]|uniref:Cysteine-rich receptor-like protein kinase 19 n=1 Tax=Melia azedarach TaxID=155640 RepID=A0ACC1XEL8_MELAZ|nr:cysteine-rich receptor-like protein kinase 19 [Melia azedarach]